MVIGALGPSQDIDIAGKESDDAIQIEINNELQAGEEGEEVNDAEELLFGKFAVEPNTEPHTQWYKGKVIQAHEQSVIGDDALMDKEGHFNPVDPGEDEDGRADVDFLWHLLRD